MRRIDTLKLAASSLACLGMLVPAPVIGAVAAPGPGAKTSARPGAEVIDLELRPGGVLVGQVIDGQGVPQRATPVSVRMVGRELASTVTDRTGRFSVRGLRGGTYEVLAGRAGAAVRVWAPGTAPPTAQQSALLVAGGTVRGQHGPIGYWLCNPFVVAAIVAAAVAIPVAIHNNRSETPASP